MKPLLFVLLLFPAFIMAQKPAVKYVTANQLKEEEIVLAHKKHHQCYYSGRYKALSRRGFYPFNKATKVMLISFKQPFDKVKAAATKPESDSTFDDHTPMYTKQTGGNYKLNKARMIQSKLITASGIDSLTNILYNYAFTPGKLPKSKTIFITEPMGCYWPRNAILFLNAQNDVIEYIEFCFQCFDIRWSSPAIKRFDLCDQKMEMIKRYFIDNGVNYGTDSNY